MTTLRVLMVGCGAMSKHWLDAACELAGVEVVGFVDVREDAARQRAAEYGANGVFVGTEVESALTQTHPEIVFDCTVPEAHVAVTLAALEHGCHVLGEKPLADTMDNARRMVEAAEQAGKLYAVIQNRRYDPNIRRLRHFLDSGAIGQLTTLNSDFYIGVHFGGFRDRMPHVLLLDMAIHTFDAARFLCNADPVAVYCHEWNPAGSWYERDAAAVAIFEMSNGVLYTYRGSWCAEGLPTTWESDWRIIGQQGTVLWRGDGRMEAEQVVSMGGFLSQMQPVDVPAWERDDSIGGHQGVIREFVRCVREGDVPETICSDNIKSLAMVFGAIESAAQRQRVDIHW